MAPVEVRTSDRKCTALCTLLFKDGDTSPGQSPSSSASVNPRRLVVLGTHLMTTSRCSPKKVAYPGEIRAAELCKIRDIAGAAAGADDAVVLMGDFNINRKSDKETHVLRGAVPRNPRLDASAAATALPSALELDTGFATAEGVAPKGGWSSFNWARTTGAPLTLVDAHEGLSTREFDDQGRALGTSHNAERVETIDYCW